MSPEKRNKKATQIRSKTSKSSKKVSKKDYDILDVNQQAVEKALISRGVALLIHGHTHRPAEHEFEVDGETVKRIVLGDWGEESSYITAQIRNFELVY